MTSMSFRRKDSSTAFFSHWLTVQLPSIAAFGHAHLAFVEQVERRLHGIASRQ
jgi:hypothetical protein